MSCIERHQYIRESLLKFSSNNEIITAGLVSNCKLSFYNRHEPENKPNVV